MASAHTLVTQQNIEARKAALATVKAKLALTATQLPSYVRAPHGGRFKHRRNRAGFHWRLR